MRTYVTPKEVRQRLHRYDAKMRLEGSHQRSELHAVWHFLVADQRRYVHFNFSTGKYKTIQEPQGDVLYDFTKTLSAFLRGAGGGPR